MNRLFKHKARAAFFTAGILFASLTVMPSALAATVGSVGSWQTSPQTIPDNPVNASYVTANGYAYAIGGTNNFGNLNDVSYAKLNADGSTSAWTSSPNVLPNNLFYSSAVTYNGYVYVMGGYNFGYFNTVYYAKLNSDGSVGSWTTSPNHLPDAIYFGAAVTSNGYVYYLGGNDSGGSVNTVYYAKLNSDGSVGSWTTSPNHLPDTIISAGAVTANGYAYIIGGDGNSGTLDTVYYAKLNTDGTVGSWQASPNTLPQALDGVEAVTENGYAYVLGGSNGSSGQNSVYYAALNADGTVGSWQTSPNTLTQALEFGVAYAANNYIYYGGGQKGGTAENAVYYAFVTPPPPAPAVTTSPSDPAAPDTGYGKPASYNLLVLALTSGAIISAGAGLFLAQRRKT